ncbi:hypothetical protein BHM03_00009066 [Ensete ventricosum]|nr:hypothetical protein BHM03_00009066 [Ensete ventricosum]
MGRTSSRPSPSPPIEVPTEGVRKRPNQGRGKLSRNKTKVTVSKCPKKVAPGERAPRNKEKELVKEATGSLDRPPTMRELCEVDGRTGMDKYFITQNFELHR